MYEPQPKLSTRLHPFSQLLTPPPFFVPPYSCLFPSSCLCPCLLLLLSASRDVIICLFIVGSWFISNHTVRNNLNEDIYDWKSRFLVYCVLYMSTTKGAVVLLELFIVVLCMMEHVSTPHHRDKALSDVNTEILLGNSLQATVDNVRCLWKYGRIIL